MDYFSLPFLYDHSYIEYPSELMIKTNEATNVKETESLMFTAHAMRGLWVQETYSRFP